MVDEVEIGNPYVRLAASVHSGCCPACRELGVQLFLTTHSLEAVDSLLASVGEIMTSWLSG